MHPKNKHKGRYNFPPLIKTNPALEQHIFTNEHGSETINFFEPSAVKELNKALLLHYYDLEYWDFPDNNLCPPIPGRADHLLYLNDLLKESTQAKEEINVLDIGTGANCIYPLIGVSLFGWNFVASEVDPNSVKAAQKNILNNPSLEDKVEIRLQKDKGAILDGIIQAEEFYHLSICNPPFHASASEAASGSSRKLKNLKGKKSKTPILNFGGKGNELWYPGGEIQFVLNYIQESKEYKNQVLWFSCLISKEENLSKAKKALGKAQVKRFRILDMSQGNKKSRILAWNF